MLVKANTVSDYLPNNNFNIIEFDKNTNKPKLRESSESTKELLDNAKKAKEKEAEIKKQNESKSKLTYENYKSKMSDLTSKVYFDKKFFGFDSNINYFFNSLVQAVFWVGKLVFYVIAELYSAVESMSDVSSLLNEAVKNSSKVFSSLFSQEIIYMVGASMAAYLLYMRMSKQMILAVFVHSAAFRAKSEFIFGMLRIGSPADRASVHTGTDGLFHMNRMHKLSTSFYLLRLVS